MAAARWLAGLRRRGSCRGAAFATRSRSAGWQTTRTARATVKVWRASGSEPTELPCVPDGRQFASSPISQTAPVIASMILGSPNRSNWTRAQRDLVAAAEWVCLTIGPAEATRTALAVVRPDAKVVWAVKGRRASASRRSCIGHRRAGGYRRVQPWRGRIRRPKPAFRPARGSDLKSSLRRAVARASRFQKAVAKMSFQSSRSRRMTQPAPATRSWAASSRPRS